MNRAPRLLVLGGFGFFGNAAARLLEAEGLRPLRASRRPGADVRVDVEDPSSLRTALRPGDVLLDAVGPFQDRTTALIEAAVEIGCAVADLSDSLGYAERVYALESKIAASRAVILTGCSTISAISAAAIRRSGIREPVRFTLFLAPAARYSAQPATAASFLRSIGRPIRVLRDGRWTEETGLRRRREFELPPPIGRARGGAVETADGLALPRVWPSLRTVEFFVHSTAPGFDALLWAAARSRAVRRAVAALSPLGLRLARAFGSRAGGVAFEVEGEGRLHYGALFAPREGYWTPVVPAAMAVRAILEGRFEGRGLVPADRQTEPGALFRFLSRLGVCLANPTDSWAKPS